MDFPQNHPIMYERWFEKLQNITDIQDFELFEATTDMSISEIEHLLMEKALINLYMFKQDEKKLNKLQEMLRDTNEQLKGEKGKLQRIKRNRYATKKSINRLEEEKTEIQKNAHELLTHVKKCKEEKDKLSELQTELQKYSEVVKKYLQDKKRSMFGLTPERIQKFQHFVADESLVGDQCGVCLDYIEIGRKMIRLDCNHVFCPDCVGGWFAGHNTCPNCRHVFNRI